MLTFLHVPHTGGRALKRALQTNSLTNAVHNETDFKNKPIHKTQYFIFRPTVERIVGQVLHYSRNLKRVGQVNHLDVRTLPPGYDIDNPFHFIELEVNRNVYCKFLLNRTDFSVPIVDADFEKLCILFRENPPIWDMYEFPIKTPNLEKVLGPLTYPVFRQSTEDDHKRLLSDVKFVNTIKKLNKFDIMLYEIIQ